MEELTIEPAELHICKVDFKLGVEGGMCFLGDFVIGKAAEKCRLNELHKKCAASGT